jgi:hypothetical protein
MYQIESLLDLNIECSYFEKETPEIAGLRSCDVLLCPVQIIADYYPPYALPNTRYLINGLLFSTKVEFLSY